MDRIHYEEMCENLGNMLQADIFEGRKIYLFGHCNATETLADLLLEEGVEVAAILDNNEKKWGRTYRDIIIEAPQEIIAEAAGSTLVCIAARAYEAMAEQLKSMGYADEIYRMVEYDSFAEYSLSEETRRRKQERLERGLARLRGMSEKFPDYMKVFCPFEALGDICFAMSYLPYFLDARGIEKCVVSVIGPACAQVAGLFGNASVEILTQKKMDEVVQAVLYTDAPLAFIAHQDRPYVVDLHKALSVKCIPLEQIYCCGVFGLPAQTKPCRPLPGRRYPGLSGIRKGRAVILSPYAKSVTALPAGIWEEIVRDYKEHGFQCYTNVAGDEKALAGTWPVRPKLEEIQSLAEYAGTFIGIRSGLCDVLRYADCRKVALYPDYNYCDTEWKAIDMYALEGWENIMVKDGFVWKRN